MYIFIESIKNVFRNKGRNFLLGLVVFVLIASTSVALIINGTTKEIIQDYKSSFGSQAYLNINFEKLMEEAENESEGGMIAFPTPTPITNEQYLDFAKSEHLKSYQILASMGITFDGLKAIGEEKQENGFGSIGKLGGEWEDYASPVANIKAYSNKKTLKISIMVREKLLKEAHLQIKTRLWSVKSLQNLIN